MWASLYYCTSRSIEATYTMLWSLIIPVALPRSSPFWAISFKAASKHDVHASINMPVCRPRRGWWQHTKKELDQNRSASCRLLSMKINGTGPSLFSRWLSSGSNLFRLKTNLPPVFFVFQQPALHHHPNTRTSISSGLFFGQRGMV